MFQEEVFVLKLAPELLHEWINTKRYSRFTLEDYMADLRDFFQLVISGEYDK